MDKNTERMTELLLTGNVLSSEFLDVVVAATKEFFGADIAFLSKFEDDLKEIRKVAGDGASIGLYEEDKIPLAGTYCYRVVRGELPNIVSDTANDERVRDLPITRQLNIKSYIGVPVPLPEGGMYGTLCCLYKQPEFTLQERDLQFLHILARLVGDHLAQSERIVRDRRLKYERVKAIIAQQAVRMVFQPIVDMQTLELVGAESLARFDAEPQRTPDLWFSEAWEVGLGAELEMMAVQLALEQLPDMPRNTYLSVNVSPDTMQLESFLKILEANDVSRIVVEITEHAIVKEYDPLLEARRRLKGIGMRLAVDDIGAGYSGLSHLLQVGPEIIKLDLSLTRDIHQNLAKQAMTTAVVSFASRVGMAIVAEGVETAEDALALKLLGVQYGQGYYFAKPGPLPIAPLSKDAE